MDEKESRRSRMTKLLLKTALIELMQEKTFDKVTIKELCEKADLNRTTFYLHYNNQRDVLDDIEKDLMDKTSAFLKASNNTSQIVNLIEEFLKYIQNDKQTFKTMLVNNPDGNFQMEFINQSLSCISENLPVYKDQTTTGYVLSFIMHGSLSIIIKWLESDCNPEAKDIAQLLFKLSNDIYASLK